MHNAPSNVVVKKLQPKSLSAASLKEISTEELIRAIRSPGDESFTMERTRRCLNLYYQHDMNAQDRVIVLESFARALRDIPRWSVSQAFDGWERDERRRPTPADIGHRARAAVERLAAEVRHRNSQSYRQEPERERATGDQTKAAMEAAGFTPLRLDQVRRNPTARTDAELLTGAIDRAPHWTESADPNGAEMAALKKARAENPLITAARGDQARQADLRNS